jgi:hypothetical protein
VGPGRQICGCSCSHGLHTLAHPVRSGGVVCVGTIQDVWGVCIALVGTQLMSHIYIYIVYICYILPRVMDPLVHHLDPKVEPTGEPADRPSHPDSHARTPAPSPTHACLPRRPHPASRARARSLIRVPPPQYRHVSRSHTTRPTPRVLARSTPAHVAQPFFEISPLAQSFLL